MSEKIYDAISLETVERLAAIVSENDLDEIIIADGEKSVTVKGRKCPPPMPPAPMPAVAAVSVPVRSADTVSETKEAAAEAAGGSPVKAPIVGTYYSSPAPDKPPFVSVGQHVRKGDVLMIIESMKLMNEIQSEYDGVIDEILVKNGQAVEYDQVIMTVKED